MGEPGADLDLAIVFTGRLGPLAEEAFSNHVVSGRVLLPGVAFMEMGFSARGQGSVLAAVTFLTPCPLPHPNQSTGKLCALRYVERDTGAFELSSRRISIGSNDDAFVLHVIGQQEPRVDAYLPRRNRYSVPYTP